jgi:hypothetical protein
MSTGEKEGKQMKRYIVKLRGEFEVTQAVVAEDEEGAKEKARQGLGETINRTATGKQEVVDVKEMKDKP